MLTGDKSRQSFIFYDSMLAALLEIGEHDAFLFLKAIKNYRAGLEVKFDQPIKQALWQATFKGQLDRDTKKYESTVAKRKEAGRAGAEKRWQTITNDGKNSKCHNEMANDNKRWQTIAKMAVSVSGTDTESRRDEVKERTLKSSKENSFSLTRSKGKSSFVPPTIEEVRAYCLEKGYDVDSEQFVNFYESKGWMIGRSHMKDWQAAVRTWEKRIDNGSQKYRDDCGDISSLPTAEQLLAAGGES